RSLLPSARPPCARTLARFPGSPPSPDLPSPPTRRSSDLGVFIGPKVNLITINHDPNPDNRNATYGRPIVIEDKVWIGIGATVLRSEEHTPELQSRFELVCRLLLEKKKQNSHNIHEGSGRE